MTTIADMSLEELRKLIDEILDRNLWTPPPGPPSTTELLREDRDR